MYYRVTKVGRIQRNEGVATYTRKQLYFY